MTEKTIARDHSRNPVTGKGIRKLCPGCIVKTVRYHYPSQTGVYMGFRHEQAKVVVCFWFYYCRFEKYLVCNTNWEEHAPLAKFQVTAPHK